MSSALVLPTRAVVSMADRRRGNPFDQYKPIQNVEEKPAKAVEKNTTIEKMFRLYNAVFGSSYKAILHKETNYSSCFELIKKAKEEGFVYTSKDIEELSLFFGAYQKPESKFHLKYTLGYFLSALINLCEQEEVIIYTHHFESAIDALGYQNNKSITINGGAGCYCGELNEGKIIIRGNVSHCLAKKMKHGEIILFGNARSSVAEEMEGGKLTIHGNTADALADRAISGEVTVIGDVDGIVNIRIRASGTLVVRVFGNIKSILHGGSFGAENGTITIYHNGVLIWKDGVKILGDSHV